MFFSVIFLFCVSVVIYQAGNYGLFRYFDGIYMSFMLLLHPLFYLYAFSLVRSRISAGIWMINCAPALFYLAATSIIYIIITPEQAHDYLTGNMYGIPSDVSAVNILYDLFRLNKIIHGLQAGIYFLMVIRLLRSQNNELEQLFSAPDRYPLRWLFSFNIIYTLMSLTGVTVNFIPTDMVQSAPVFIDVTMLVIAFFTFYMGRKGVDQSTVKGIVEDLDRKAPGMKEEEEALSDHVVLTRVIKYVEEQRAFLNPELKIWDVVENTGINRTYISKAINAEMKMSFTSFVNNYRTDHACMLIRDNHSLTLESIAYESGFNSISTFKRAFKAIVGRTPSEYRQEAEAGK